MKVCSLVLGFAFSSVASLGSCQPAERSVPLLELFPHLEQVLVGAFGSSEDQLLRSPTCISLPATPSVDGEASVLAAADRLQAADRTAVLLQVMTETIAPRLLELATPPLPEAGRSCLVQGLYSALIQDASTLTLLISDWNQWACPPVGPPSPATAALPVLAIGIPLQQGDSFHDFSRRLAAVGAFDDHLIRTLRSERVRGDFRWLHDALGEEQRERVLTLRILVDDTGSGDPAELRRVLEVLITGAKDPAAKS